MPLLELRNACKGYGTKTNRTEVLHNINLTVEPNEFLAIVGYSGAGKSTLISLISGLLEADSGQVLLNGKPITGPGPDRAVVFQNYSLLPWLSVFDNIMLAVTQVFPKLSRAQRRDHVDHYIAMVNLTQARDKTPAELSGGMRQRVSVARALAMKPQVLLMDEPFSALDALTRATLQDELMRIFSTDKTTVLMITNDVDEAALLADRIIPLSVGPSATLGPEVVVDIARPRERKGLNHQPRFKEIRKAVFDYLLGPGRRRDDLAAEGSAVETELAIPELAPRDLTTRRRPDRLVLQSVAV